MNKEKAKYRNTLVTPERCGRQTFQTNVNLSVEKEVWRVCVGNEDYRFQSPKANKPLRVYCSGLRDRIRIPLDSV